MHDLHSELNNYALLTDRSDPLTSDIMFYTVNNVSASSASARLSKALNSITKRSFRCRFMQKFLLFTYFVFFLVFKHDFVSCVDFTCIEASNTASDGGTN